MTPEEELAGLERKLAAREDQPGFAANVAHLKDRIAELKRQFEQ